MSSFAGIYLRRLRYSLTPQWDIYNSLAPMMDGQQVLEVGCGTGLGTVQLARWAKHIEAWEIDPDAVSFAQKMLPLVKVHWSCNDFMQMVGAHQYDAVVMIEVLEHIPDWQTALALVATHLAPEGRFYISAKNANADLRRNDEHEREWTAREFRTALAGYFSRVTLFDYSGAAEQDDSSRVTPLVAVCVK